MAPYAIQVFVVSYVNLFAKAVISNVMHERIYVNYVYKIHDGLTLMLDIISFMIVKACVIYK